MLRLASCNVEAGAAQSTGPSFGFFLRVPKGAAGVCHVIVPASAARMVREAAAAVAQPLVMVVAVLAKLFDRGPAGGRSKPNAASLMKSPLTIAVKQFYWPRLLVMRPRRYGRLLRGHCDIVAFRNCEQIGRLRAFLDIVQFRPCLPQVPLDHVT